MQQQGHQRDQAVPLIPADRVLRQASVRPVQRQREGVPFTLGRPADHQARVEERRRLVLHGRAAARVQLAGGVVEDPVELHRLVDDAHVDVGQDSAGAPPEERRVVPGGVQIVGGDGVRAPPGEPGGAPIGQKEARPPGRRGEHPGQAPEGAKQAGVQSSGGAAHRRGR